MPPIESLLPLVEIWLDFQVHPAVRSALLGRGVLQGLEAAILVAQGRTRELDRLVAPTVALDITAAQVGDEVKPLMPHSGPYCCFPFVTCYYYLINCHT